MLQKHVANALLALQDLLEQNEVLVLNSVDIAREMCSNLLDSQLLRLLVVLIELLSNVSNIVSIVPRVPNLFTKHIVVVHVVANSL